MAAPKIPKIRKTTNIFHVNNTVCIIYMVCNFTKLWQLVNDIITKQDHYAKKKNSIISDISIQK